MTPRRFKYPATFVFLAFCVAFFAHGAEKTALAHVLPASFVPAKIVAASIVSETSDAARKLSEAAPRRAKAVFLRSIAERDAATGLASGCAPRQEKKKRQGFHAGDECRSVRAAVRLPVLQRAVQAYKTPVDDTIVPGKRPDDPRASPESRRRVRRPVFRFVRG